MQGAPFAGRSARRTRTVSACTAFFTAVSHSPVLHIGAVAKTGRSANAATSSSRLDTSTLRASRRLTRTLEDRALGRLQQRRKPGCKPVERKRLLGAVDAVNERDIATGEVLGADDDAQRHTAQLPVRVFLTGAHTLATIDAKPDSGGALAFELRCRLLHHRRARLVIAPRDRDDDDLDRRDLGRKDEAHVITVGHDDRAHSPRRQPP